ALNYGLTSLEVIAYDSCDNSSTCTTEVTVEPSACAVQCSDQTIVIPVCDFDTTICFDVSSNGCDSTTVEVFEGEVDDVYFNGNEVCFGPSSSGDYRFEIRGWTDQSYVTCSQLVTLEQAADPVQIICPEPLDTSVCGPGTICIDLPILNATSVTTSNGSYDDINSELCFFADTSGHYVIEVQAANACGFDACQVVVDVVVDLPVVVNCLPDTAVQRCGLGQICLPILIHNTDSIDVNGIMYHEVITDVCFYADTSGLYHVDLTAYGCTDETCSFDVTVTIDPAPSVGCYQFSDTLPGPGEVTVPIDVSGAYDSVVINPSATFNGDSFTFYAGTAGTYSHTVTVYGCGLITSCQSLTTVAFCTEPIVTLPEPFEIVLCELADICLPFTVEADNITNITSNIGYIGEGDVCFLPDTFGVYEVIVEVTNACNLIGSDTCLVTVTPDDPGTIACPDDTSVTLCQAGTMCIPITVDPWWPVTVTPPDFWYDTEALTICVNADTSGAYVVNVTAETNCGPISCSFRTDVIINSAPIVEVSDTTVSLCGLNQICLPLLLSDTDGNIVNVISNIGSIVDNTICFNPDTSGVYQVIITATDSCGATGEDTSLVTVDVSLPPTIDCPEPHGHDLCFADSVFEDVAVGNADSVWVSYGIYDAASGTVRFDATESGPYDILVKAFNSCDSAQCGVSVVVDILDVLTVYCPGNQSHNLEAPGDVCASLPIVESGALLDSVKVFVEATESSDTGWYDGNNVCFTASFSDTYHITVQIWDNCGRMTECLFDDDVVVGQSFGCSDPNLETAIRD
ncbi:MAG: hypothetical protein V3T31_01580, partial [candidate division Zixibacteria bacterium]